MQGFLYQITLLIAGMAVVVTLLEVLIPQGKLKKTVLFAIGLVFLLSVSAPIVRLVTSGPSGELFQMEELPELTPVPGPSYEDLLRKYYEQSLEESE
ncbi:MAG TPA: stage III sporulation protein AF [Feifaniaceae bacterium]|nr:stage III sporulation protein AF [Feifaniaceae bacterium]